MSLEVPKGRNLALKNYIVVEIGGQVIEVNSFPKERRRNVSTIDRTAKARYAELMKRYQSPDTQVIYFRTPGFRQLQASIHNINLDWGTPHLRRIGIR